MIDIPEEEIKMEANKMTYNAKNVEVQESLNPGLMAQGFVIDIKDGKVKDFVQDDALPKWKNKDQSCILVTFECKHNEVSYTDQKLLTYNISDKGATQFGKRSNLGKYHSYYKKVPEVGDQVQMKTNADGYFKVVIE